jgi:hypothetical protein
VPLVGSFEEADSSIIFKVTRYGTMFHGLRTPFRFKGFAALLVVLTNVSILWNQVSFIKKCPEKFCRPADDLYFICFLVLGHDCELLVWDAVQGDVSALGSLRIQPHHLRQDSIPKKSQEKTSRSSGPGSVIICTDPGLVPGTDASINKHKI